MIFFSILRKNSKMLIFCFFKKRQYFSYFQNFQYFHVFIFSAQTNKKKYYGESIPHTLNIVCDLL